MEPDELVIVLILLELYFDRFFTPFITSVGCKVRILHLPLQ